LLFVWDGKYELLEFDVKVPESAPQIETVLKFDVSISDIVVARLRLDLAISRSAAKQERAFVSTEPAKTAFASYSSKDRPRVLDRIAEIKKNGIDVFLDCLSLHPGEEWKPRLESEIKNRELFLLFWSANAKASEYVTWEWKTALSAKGIGFIDPHPLEPVSEAEPPDELKSLHFGDPHMLIRKAYDTDTKNSGR